MIESVAKEIIQLFPHSTSDLVFNVIPLLLYLHNLDLLHPTSPSLLNLPYLLNPEPPLQLPQVQEKMLKEGT